MKNQVKEILEREILRDIYDKRIFLIESNANNANKFRITEACDEWFYYDLTKEQCLELAKVFSDLAKCFEDCDNQTEKGGEAE